MGKLGEKIHDERLASGLTQDEIAKDLHVTRQTISSWENGRTEPNYTMLQKLANAMKIDMAKFFEE